MIPILLNPAFSNTRIEGRLYSNTKANTLIIGVCAK